MRIRFYVLLAVLLFSATVQAQFTALNGPVGGDIRDIERASNGTLYTITSNTLYQSTNNGTSWTKTTITAPASGVLFEDIMISPTGKFYAVTYNEVYTSTDATNWTKVNTTQFYGMLKIRRIGPDGFIMLYGWNGMWVSKDDGVTFTQILANNSIVDPYSGWSVTANSAGDLFAGTYEGIKRYLYPGASVAYDAANWTTVYPMTGVQTINLGVDGSDNVYASTLAYTGNAFLRLIGRSLAADKGAVGTWNSIPLTGFTTYTNDWRGFWQANGSTLYFFNDGDNRKIYSTNASLATTTYSLTGGITTANSDQVTVTSTALAKIGDRITGANIPAGTVITGKPSATLLFLSNRATASGAGLTLTGNTLTSPWAVIDAPSAKYGSAVRNTIFLSGSSYLVGSDGAGILSTTNSGASFSLASNGLTAGNGYDVAVANVTGRIIYINSNRSKGYWTSTDNGITWSFVDRDHYFRKVVKLASGKIVLFGDRVYLSTDNGATFNDVYAQGFNDMEIDPSNPTHLYGISGNNIHKSIDDGLTWTTQAIPATIPARPSGYIIAHAINTNGDIYFVQQENDNKIRLYKISGGVTSFVQNAPWLASDDYFYPNNLFFQNGKLYVANFNALYATPDGGETWSSNSFSGDFVFPISQGTFSGIAVSKPGTLYITQNEGKTFNSNPLPGSNAVVTNLVLDNLGRFVASALRSPALRFTGPLLVDPATVPPVIEFTWQPTGGPYGGPTDFMIKDNGTPAKLYTYSYRGYYRANLTATSWTKLSFPSNYNYLSDIATNKTTNTLYGIVYDRMFSSTDGGVTWSNIPNSENLFSRTKLTVCPNGNIVMITEGKKVFVSTNGGLTFGAAKLTAAADENIYGDRGFLATSNNVIFTDVSNNTTFATSLKRSSDAGASWATVPLPDGLTSFNRLSTDNSGNIYLITGSNIYKSSNNGDTWTSIKGDLTGNWTFYAKVYVSPSNPSELYFTTLSNNDFILKKSVNGGTNWTTVGNMGKANVFAIEWLGTDKLVAATFGGIITSNDNGATFVDSSNGITNLVDGSIMVGSSTRLNVASADFSHKTENSGTTWSRTELFLRNFFTHPDGSTIAVTTSGDRAYKSVDGGANWNLYCTFATSNTRRYFTADGTNHYAYNFNELYYSNNLTSWTKLNVSGLPAPNQFYFHGLSADPNGIIYGIIYNYQTQKLEAYQILFGSALLLNQVANPQNFIYKEGKTYLFGSEGLIASTTDGTTWEKKAAPSGYKLIIAAKNYFFVSQYGGTLWLSRDGGNGWQNVGLGTQSSFTDVALNELDGFAYATLDGFPVMKSDKIIIADDATGPVIASLSPANNATNVAINTKLTVTFDEGVIPQAGKNIRVFDLANTNLNEPVASIAITDGVQSGKSFTYTLTAPLSYSKTYFVIIDQGGSYKDIFGNAFATLFVSSTWRFTTAAPPDTQAPVITHTVDNLVQGSGNKIIGATITDNVAVTTAKIFYRSITSNAVETEANLTLNSGKYEITIPESTFGKLGLEYYFISTDASGNSTTSPAPTGTGTSAIKNYYYSYINYPSTSASVDFTSKLGIGGELANWKIIAVPFKLTNASIASVFEELGPKDDSKWRIVTLKNGNSWGENPTDFSSFAQGVGYFANIKSLPTGVSKIAIENGSTPTNTKKTLFSMTLRPGWNQIGNPYTFPITWSEVLASNTGVTAIGPAKTFNGSAYVNKDLIGELEGAFVFNSSPTPVVVNVPVISAAGGRIESENYDLGQENWVLPITVKSGEIENTLGGVGMHRDAQLGIDQHDDFNPPAITDFIQMDFDHPEHFVKASTRDVVPTQDEYKWSFTLKGNIESPTELIWDNTRFGNNSKEVFLYDIDRGILVDMREEQSYRVNPKKSGVIEIYFGENLRSKIKPQRVILGEAYPNPGFGDVTIPFTLPEKSASYLVTMEVFDLMGRKITTLVEKSLAPGFYTSHWETTQANLTNGLYTYRMTVVGNDRSEVLNGKVILNQ